MLTRYTKKVIISYDMDEAGRRAAERAVRMFGDVGMEVKLLRLSDAKDPDEYIKKFGADRFRRMLEESRTKFDYNFENILSQYDLNNPQEKIKALAAMCSLIAGFHSAAERDVYIAEAARKFEVEPESLRRDIARLIRRRTAEARTQETQRIRQNTAGYADRVNPDFVKSPVAARAEETVLGLLFIREENRALAFSPEIALTEDDFYTVFGKKVFAFLQSAYKDGRAPDLLDEAFTPEEVGRITKMKIARLQLSENGETVFRESVGQLRHAVKEKRAEEAGGTLSDLTAFINSRKEETDGSEDD